MRHCSICGESDKNPQECDSCGYNPVGEFADEMELDWALRMDDVDMVIDEYPDTTSEFNLDHGDFDQTLGSFEMDFELALLHEKQGEPDKPLL